jgi:hypothetical protein
VTATAAAMGRGTSARFCCTAKRIISRQGDLNLRLHLAALAHELRRTWLEPERD